MGRRLTRGCVNGRDAAKEVLANGTEVSVLANAGGGYQPTGISEGEVSGGASSASIWTDA